MKKKLYLLSKSIIISLVIALFCLPAYAGQWMNNYGNWYYIEDNGNLASNKWIGNYYLGADGVMMTNSWTPDGYYVGADGAWNGQAAITTSNTGSYQVNSSLEGIYQYSYTKIAGEAPSFENGIGPVTVIRNQDGSYTASNSYGTAILTLGSDGSYSAWTEFEYWQLDETGLCIEFGDGADFFIKM